MSPIPYDFLLNHNGGLEKLPKYPIYIFIKSRENYKISPYDLPDLQIVSCGIKKN
jgi:hypothetical protein